MSSGGDVNSARNMTKHGGEHREKHREKPSPCSFDIRHNKQSAAVKPAGKNLSIRLCAAVCLLAGIASCTIFKPPQPGIGKPVDWRQVRGWTQDNHAEAWPALLSSCTALSAKAGWRDLCEAAQQTPDPDNDSARRFFEHWFTPHRLHGEAGKTTGLITGYYEPLLFGSLTPDSRYRYPLYGPPQTLLSVELGEVYPELANKRIRGRLAGSKVLPFYSREEIDSDRSLLAGNELIWVDDRDAVFFLHIQGSGRVRLPDGRIIGAGYANQNGHPYLAIGRVLIKRNELKPEEVSLFTIRQWLRDNPARAEELLFQNPSYVFFVLQENPGEGPLGSLNVPLTPQRSIAIDPTLVELGVPVWLSTNLPGNPQHPYRRLVFAQDTGSAIKGALRADLFWGHGQQAERAAGIMKESGSLIVLLPKAAGA